MSFELLSGFVSAVGTQFRGVRIRHDSVPPDHSVSQLVLIQFCLSFSVWSVLELCES